MVRIAELDTANWAVKKRPMFGSEFQFLGTFFVDEAGVYHTDERLSAHLGGTICAESLPEMRAAVRVRLTSSRPI